MSKVKIYLIIAMVGTALSYAVAVVVASTIEGGFRAELMLEGQTLVVFAVVLALSILLGVYGYISGWWGSKASARNKIIASPKKQIEGGLENASFMDSKEIASKFCVVDIKGLGEAKDGVLLFAQENKGRMSIALSKPIHTLVIGTTGSGKTETFVSPQIRLLAKTRTKPSMVISDPKGELLAKHSKALVSEGYKIQTLDLREPYKSTKWNPLESIYLSYQKYLQSEDAVEKAVIFDEVYEELSEIASVLSPMSNSSDKVWDSGARNFILATLLAMLEDSENEANGMSIERYNFYNLTKVALNSDNEYADLKKYYSTGRELLSKSRGLSGQVINASEKAFKSYITVVADKLGLFLDRGNCSLTSKNEIVLGDIDTEPTALFLIIPDERTSRHPLASLFVTTAYKELVKKANSYPSRELARACYFILDEFGNLPKLPSIDSFVTVGRSRKIFLVAVIQSYTQLENKYGKEVANIIKSNCNIKIYIGTDDTATNEEFSKSLGNYSIIGSSVSGSASKDISISDSIRERPLVYPSELAKLNNDSRGGQGLGNVIVKQVGYLPIRAKNTPFFLCDLYQKDNSFVKVEVESTPFDEGSIYYDITKRVAVSGAQEAEPPGSTAEEDEATQIALLLGIENIDKLSVEEIDEQLAAALNKADSAGDRRMASKINKLRRTLYENYITTKE